MDPDRKRRQRQYIAFVWAAAAVILFLVWLQNQHSTARHGTARLNCWARDWASDHRCPVADSPWVCPVDQAPLSIYYPRNRAHHPTGTVITVAHHANAFYVEPGCCFRLVCGTGGKMGQPHHCREPVVWRGQFVTPSGAVHQVWSCEGHASDLGAVRAVWRAPDLNVGG